MNSRAFIRYGDAKLTRRNRRNGIVFPTNSAVVKLATICDSRFGLRIECKSLLVELP